MEWSPRGGLLGGEGLGEGEGGVSEEKGVSEEGEGGRGGGSGVEGGEEGVLRGGQSIFVLCCVVGVLVWTNKTTLRRTPLRGDPSCRAFFVPSPAPPFRSLTFVPQVVSQL